MLAIALFIIFCQLALWTFLGLVLYFMPKSEDSPIAEKLQ